jgi:ComF family protein
MSLIADLINFFYPEVCAACNNALFKGEKTICTQCLFKLPKTDFHLLEGNVVEKQFWGKVQVTSATALYYFNKGERVQHLVHQLKYRGDKDVGVLTGNILGNDLLKSNRFTTIDAIVPVPLHAKKLRTRGFNQSDFFGRGLAEAMKVPFYSDLLIRLKETTTQTRKSRFSRFENVNRVFDWNPIYTVIPTHILLVDDVITTGSTLAACTETLLEKPNVKVSIATIAYARL